MSDAGAIERFDLESQTGWVGAEGEIEGMPTLVRIRQDLDLFVGHTDWPRRLTISWEYEADNPSGMPAPELSDEMRTFEDALVPAVERDKTAILAFVFTCDGLRHWHFYFSDIGAVQTRLTDALAQLPRFPLDMSAEDDPEWSLYQAVCQGAGPP